MKNFNEAINCRCLDVFLALQTHAPDFVSKFYHIRIREDALATDEFGHQ